MSTGIDLAFDDAQEAIGAAIGQFCEERCPDEVVKGLENRFDPELWRELGELGVLALLTPDGEGGALELVAAVEALGRGVFPGPLAATFFATQLLPEAQRVRVASGEDLVSVGLSPVFPWAPHASVFVELEGGRAFLAEPDGAIEPLETLGGEPWGRMATRRGAELEGVERAHVVYEIALAAQIAAAGLRLVDDTAEHARTRRQFGRPIGAFQAVAHPLADCSMALSAAATLARAAAFHLEDGGEARARPTAAAARLSACRAGVETGHVCHQLFGAIGITLEGSVFHVSRRLRQLASQPPTGSAAREALLADLDL